MNFKKRAAAIAIAVTTPLFCITGSASQRLEEALSGVTDPENQTVEVAQPVENTPDSTIKWVGRNFTSTETEVLNFFQVNGIHDRAALAVLMGNVKQESKFLSNICEGGARVTYHNCYSGGYGLIQWTTSDRYHGLGRFAKLTGGNPSALSTQLSYMLTERQWKIIESRMKTEGQSISYYMNAAYRWLGWGIHGARTHYSNQYYSALQTT